MVIMVVLCVWHLHMTSSSSLTRQPARLRVSCCICCCWPRPPSLLPHHWQWWMDVIEKWALPSSAWVAGWPVVIAVLWHLINHHAIIQPTRDLDPGHVFIISQSEQCCGVLLWLFQSVGAQYYWGVKNVAAKSISKLLLMRTWVLYYFVKGNNIEIHNLMCVLYFFNLITAQGRCDPGSGKVTPMSLLEPGLGVRVIKATKNQYLDRHTHPTAQSWSVPHPGIVKKYTWSAKV